MTFNNIIDVNKIKDIPKKTIIIISLVAAVLLIILVIGGYLYFKKSKAGANALENAVNVAQEITDSATRGVLPSLQTNPLEDKPDINPADKANPFKDIKTNPF